ncbi:MAG: hypothetical protein PHX30_03865 [Candidatus Pacebacteria bacterium]|nr:hypothetical protein [Candidatus Paceibacterota bacterium]
MIALLIWSIIKAIVAWLIIVYAGTNLVGSIGRGLLEKPLDPNEYQDYLKNEVKKWNSSGIVVAILSSIITIAICYYVYSYWGILFLIAFILVMASRIPDLYWEIRVLPKKLGVPYPVPKDLIRKAIKNQESSFWNTLAGLTIWIVLAIIFIAFFIQH